MCFEISTNLTKCEAGFFITIKYHYCIVIENGQPD